MHKLSRELTRIQVAVAPQLGGVVVPGRAAPRLVVIVHDALEPEERHARIAVGSANRLSASLVCTIQIIFTARKKSSKLSVANNVSEFSLHAELKSCVPFSATR